MSFHPPQQTLQKRPKRASGFALPPPKPPSYPTRASPVTAFWGPEEPEYLVGPPIQTPTLLRLLDMVSSVQASRLDRRPGKNQPRIHTRPADIFPVAAPKPPRTLFGGIEGELIHDGWDVITLFKPSVVLL